VVDDQHKHMYYLVCLEFIYYRCIGLNTNQEKNQVRDIILLEQKDSSVLKIGAPDCLLCQDRTDVNQPLSGIPGCAPL
jgi:hypothetical protein